MQAGHKHFVYVNPIVATAFTHSVFSEKPRRRRKMGCKGANPCPPEAKSPDNPAEGGFHSFFD
jgi:hypothetical protein